MKKVICLLLLMVMLFASSASALPGGILDGKALYRLETKTYSTKMTDGDMDTYETIWVTDSNPHTFTFELDRPTDVDYVMSHARNGGQGAVSVKMFDEFGVLLIEKILLPNLQKNEIGKKGVKKIQIVVPKNWGGYVHEFDIFGVVTHPRPVNLQTKSEIRAVTLSWQIDDSEGFKGFDVYRDMEKINDAPIMDPKYVDSTGVPGQKYKYKVAAVYGDGITMSDEVIGFAYPDLLPTPRFEGKMYHNRINLSWNDVGAKKYTLYYGAAKLYEGNGVGYSHVGLKMDTEYTYKLEYIDDYGRVQSLDKTFRTTDDETDGVLDVPEGLEVDPDVYDAILTWSQVVNPDLEGYYVYLNGSRVGGLVKEPRYHFEKLKSLTEYKAHVVSVDKFGNLSDPSDDITFKTKDLTVVPEPPKLTGKAFSGSVTLSWMPSKYAERYKVLQDGKMLAETDSTSFRVRDLKNGQPYKFSVVATNRIGDSGPSNILELTPDAKMMPDITLGYDLKDVANGTASWFSSIWTLLAFIIAIPLSFYIGNRVKGLFA